jgi:hypothetical protein
MNKRSFFQGALPLLLLKTPSLGQTQDEVTDAGVNFEEVRVMISDFIQNWTDFSGSDVKKPLEEIIWCPVTQTFRNDLMQAAVLRDYTLIWTMLIFATDFESKMLAWLLIAARPVDHSVVLRWENGMQELSRRMLPHEVREFETLMKSAKKAPKNIYDIVEKLYAISK